MTMFLMMWLTLHPFHVGLTEINYNSDSKTYQVSIKLFTDDLEKGLEEFSGLSLDIVDSDLTHSSTDSLISSYTTENFQIYSETKIDLEYIGSEREYDVTWIYLESESMLHVTEIEVTNKLLLSIFSDQTHIVHFTTGDIIQSELIHAKETTVKFQYQH